MPRRKLPSIHPGENLQEGFLGPFGLSQDRLAQDRSVPPHGIHEMVRGTRAIPADTALRPARYFGTSEHFWMNLPVHHDLEVEKDRLGDRLRRAVKVRTPRRGEPAS